MGESNTEDLMMIGEIVYERALLIFEVCKAKEDFCIQDIGGVAVFGGSNRLLFSAITGFRPDASYCSPRFLELYSLYFVEQGGVDDAAIQQVIRDRKADSER